MKKLIGDVFSDADEYMDFIFEIVRRHIIHPDRVVVYNFLEDTSVPLDSKDNRPNEIINDTLAAFSTISEKYIQVIRSGADDRFPPETDGVLEIYMKNIEKELEYESIYPGLTILDRLKIILIHECRHAQQFFYILDKFHDRNLYNKMVRYDNLTFRKDPHKYLDCILESDAELYAKYAVTKKKTRSVAGTFKLDKVMSYLITKMAKEGYCYE